MIRYSGGTYVNTTFASDGTRQTLANGIETALLAAGFTTISGSGTTNLLMQSASTPHSHQMRFRFKANTGCVTISIENVGGTIVGSNSTTAGAILNPVNGKTWQVIASQYQFCLFVVGEPDVPGEFAFGSVPWVPSFITVTDVGLLFGNSGDNGFFGTRDTFRTSIGQARSNSRTTYEAVWDNLLETNNQSAQVPAVPQLCVEVMATIGAVTTSLAGFYLGPLHWPGLNTNTHDAMMCWPLTESSEVLIRGQLWDALVLMDAFNNEATFSFDTHTWLNLTNNGVGGGNQASSRGSLVLVTS